MKAKKLSLVSLALFFVLALVCATLAACSKKPYRTIAQIKRSGQIRIAVFFDNPPFSWADEERDYQGYDVYFARRLAADLGVRPEFFHVKPDERVEHLVSGSIDVVLANYTVTEERARHIAFSLPYMKVSLGVASPKAALITDPEGLAGKKVVVVKGTTGEYYFRDNLPDVELVRVGLFPQTFTALTDGKVDALAADAPSIMGWLSTHPDYALGIETIGEPSIIAAGVNQENTELLQWINDEIVKLGEESFFHKDFEATVRPFFGDAADPDALVVEGGKL